MIASRTFYNNYKMQLKSKRQLLYRLDSFNFQNCTVNFSESDQNNKTFAKSLKNRRTKTKNRKGNPDAVEVKLINKSVKIHIVGNSNSKTNDK